MTRCKKEKKTRRGKRVRGDTELEEKEYKKEIMRRRKRKERNDETSKLIYSEKRQWLKYTSIKSI